MKTQSWTPQKTELLLLSGVFSSLVAAFLQVVEPESGSAGATGTPLFSRVPAKELQINKVSWVSKYVQKS